MNAPDSVAETDAALLMLALRLTRDAGRTAPRALTRLAHGLEPGPESSLVKLFWATLTQDLQELALALAGPDAVRADGRFAQSLLCSRVSSLAGGTSEVQANIIAQRLLGLPRG